MTLTTGTLRLGTAGSSTTVIRYEILNGYGSYSLSSANAAKNEASSPDSMRDYSGYNHLHVLGSAPSLSWDLSVMTITWSDNNSGESGYRIERKLNAGGWSYVANDTNGSPYVDAPTCGGSNTYYYRLRAYIGSQYADWRESSGEGAECCLLGDHKLQVAPNKFKAIEDIRKGDLLYTAHHRDLSDMNYFEVLAAIPHKVDGYYIVYFEDGSRIRCSSSHRFMIDSGVRVAASRLIVGDAIMQYKDGFKGQVVKSILQVEEEEIVYKITVSCAHSFMTEDGLLHHNEK